MAAGSEKSEEIEEGCGVALLEDVEALQERAVAMGMALGWGFAAVDVGVGKMLSESCIAGLHIVGVSGIDWAPETVEGYTVVGYGFEAHFGSPSS